MWNLEKAFAEFDPGWRADFCHQCQHEHAGNGAAGQDGADMAKAELAILNKIEDLDQLSYTHVLKIFRFLHTAFFNRLSMGEIEYASDLATCLVQLGGTISNIY